MILNLTSENKPFGHDFKIVWF